MSLLYYFAVTSTELLFTPNSVTSNDYSPLKKVNDNVVVDNKNKRYNRYDGTG